MNYAFLPDLSALTILIIILAVLRRRHPQEQAGVWLLGLFFTLIEAVAHMFYARSGMPSKLLHVVVLDCYLATGAIFIWAAGDPQAPRRARLLYLLVNGLTVGFLITVYGLNIRSPQVYTPAIAAGIIVGVLSSLMLRRSWRIALGQAAAWLGAGVLISIGDFRTAIYWSLCCVYLVLAWKFQRRLKRGSTGRLALLTGFYIWALCFLVHPLIIQRAPAYAEIASHVWNMQKSLIVIGMLLLMLERQADHNKWLALHDALTGLPNRRRFEEKFQTSIEDCRPGKRVALFLLDLNGFKAINDTLGHHAGDQVLGEVANRLRTHLESYGTLARLGGDEFIVLVANPDGFRTVARVREAIRYAMDPPIQLEGSTVRATASIGVAIYPDDTSDPEKLLRVADRRMYELKARNRPLGAEPAEEVYPMLVQDMGADKGRSEAGLPDLNLYGGQRNVLLGKKDAIPEESHPVANRLFG